MLANISSLVGVKWYLGWYNNRLSSIVSTDIFKFHTPGVPMNDTKVLRLGMAEVGEAILGDNLLGLQVGNEPDLYGRCVPRTLGSISL